MFHRRTTQPQPRLMRCCSCGTGVVAPSSSNDLAVGYVGFIDIACAGALNPAFDIQGYVVEHLVTVTALLIDRSFGQFGVA
jgi:hypothetical protein